MRWSVADASVMDYFNREALPIEIALNIPAQKMVSALDRTVANSGYLLKVCGTKTNMLTQY